MHWHEIDGWFQWRSAQEEAAHRFPEGSCFVEVGTYLGRSLCSLAEVVERSGKTFTLIDYDEIKWPEVVKAVGDLLPGAKAWSTQQWRWIVA